MDLIITILLVATKDLPISPRFTPYIFLSRCKFSTLTTRQPMVEFYLLTFPRFPLRKKEHKSYFGKNRTHDFRISGSAGYLVDHSRYAVRYITGIRPTSCSTNEPCGYGVNAGEGRSNRRDRPPTCRPRMHWTYLHQIMCPMPRSRPVQIYGDTSYSKSSVAFYSLVLSHRRRYSKY